MADDTLDRVGRAADEGGPAPPADRGNGGDLRGPRRMTHQTAWSTWSLTAPLRDPRATRSRTCRRYGELLPAAAEILARGRAPAGGRCAQLKRRQGWTRLCRSHQTYCGL